MSVNDPTPLPSPDAFQPDLRQITPEAPAPAAAPEGAVTTTPTPFQPPEPPPQPQPGFRWSVVWCIGFLLVTQGPGALIAIVVLLVYSMLHPAEAQAAAMLGSPVMSAAMAAAFLVTEILVIGVSLLAIRIVVGRDWKRLLAVRRPSVLHVGLAVVSLPALVVLANAAYALLKRGLPRLTAPVAALAGQWPWVLVLGCVVAFFLAIAYMLWLDSRRPRGVSAGDVALTVGSMTGLVLLLAAAFFIFMFAGQDMMEQMGKMFGAWPWPFGVLVIGMGPGIGEELWCRGFLGRGLVGRHGVVLGVLLTSFFFGLIHLDPYQGTAAMLIGLYLHFTYLVTRSLWVPMLLHFLNNSLAVVGSRIPALDALDADPAKAPVHLFVAAAVLLAAVIWTLCAGRARLSVQGTGELWRPAVEPGVEYPPEDSGVVVVRPWPGVVPLVATLAAAAAFVYSCYMTLSVK
jgi:membrane protease YdiL (CAAX protease family)